MNKKLIVKKETKETPKTSPANRYQLAWNKLYSTLPEWKKEIINKKDDNSAIVKTFVKEVADLAESDKEIFITC